MLLRKVEIKIQKWLNNDSIRRANVTVDFKLILLTRYSPARALDYEYHHQIFLPSFKQATS